MTNSRNSQTHILLFSGDLPALCVSASVFPASLPSPSLQTLLHPSCWPQKRTEFNRSNFLEREEGPPLRFFSSSSSPLEIWLTFGEGEIVLRWTGCKERKQRNTRDSSQLRVQSVLLGLCSSVAGWQLSVSSPLANGGLSPSDNTPLCSKGGF